MNNGVLGKRFAKMRRSAGVSQEVLSGFSGVSEVTISQFENGKRGVNTRTLEALLNALGVEMTFTPQTTGRGKGNGSMKLTRVQRAIYYKVRAAGHYESLFALTDELDLNYSHAYLSVRAMEAAGVLRVEKPGRDLVLSVSMDWETVL